MISYQQKGGPVHPSSFSMTMTKAFREFLAWHGSCSAALNQLWVFATEYIAFHDIFDTRALGILGHTFTMKGDKAIWCIVSIVWSFSVNISYLGQCKPERDDIKSSEKNFILAGFAGLTPDSGLNTQKSTRSTLALKLSVAPPVYLWVTDTLATVSICLQMMTYIVYFMINIHCLPLSTLIFLSSLVWQPTYYLW